MSALPCRAAACCGPAFRFLLGSLGGFQILLIDRSIQGDREARGCGVFRDGTLEPHQIRLFKIFGIRLLRSQDDIVHALPSFRLVGDVDTNQRGFAVGRLLDGVAGVLLVGFGLRELLR